VSECQKEYQMRVTYDDTKNGRKNETRSNLCQRVKKSIKLVSESQTECQMCVTCDDTKMVEK